MPQSNGVLLRTSDMARILHNNEWYDELGSGSLYEAEFERIFRQYVPKTYPGFIAVPFKKTVYSDHTSARADLALIRTDYLGWWVVEVERAVHSFSAHVLPQVRTLATARYGRDEATYLATKSDQLDSGRLFDMIRGDQPRVLVVVDMPRDNWKTALEQHQAKLAVFQIFRSGRGQYLIRLNGYHPTVDPLVRSPCSFDPVLRNLLTVGIPAILPSDTSDQIPIYYQGKLTLWRRIDTADRVSLSPIATLNFDPTALYEIVLEADSLKLQLAN